MRFLDPATSREWCPFDTAEAHHFLAVAGRELAAGVPAFNGSWLPDTVLYGRIAGRRFPAGEATAPDDLDTAFGAAVLLAVVVESEEWPAVSDSLALGPLRGLEPVYLARIEGNQGEDVEASLDQFGFAEPQRRILADWARGCINFTVS